MSPGISRDFAGFFQGAGVRTRFGPFTLDLDTRQLIREGREIHLAPKAFELLSALVLDRPKALSKADLQERLWPGIFVAEANLSNLVAEIREALDDAARAPRFVRTAHGFGYAFCGDAVSLPGSPDAAPASVSHSAGTIGMSITCPDAATTRPWAGQRPVASAMRTA